MECRERRASPQRPPPLEELQVASGLGVEGHVLAGGVGVEGDEILEGSALGSVEVFQNRPRRPHRQGKVGAAEGLECGHPEVIEEALACAVVGECRRGEGSHRVAVGCGRSLLALGYQELGGGDAVQLRGKLHRG